ncbi:MAG: hypothetical protein AAGF10_00240 [Verrucomicrobiota bacterium]
MLERSMLDAFAAAVERDPDNRDFRIRYAEAFFDVRKPNWKHAIALWTELESGARSALERELILLQQARVQIELGRRDQARKLLQQVNEPSLREARAELMVRTR